MPIQVNANRMELLKLKRKNQIAIRGHKLLKDKLEGLLRDFMDLIKEYKNVRQIVDKELSNMFQNMILASTSMTREAYATALSFSQCRTMLEIQEKLVMNVRIPSFDFKIEGNLLGYGLETTSYDLDLAMGNLKEVLQTMVKLAELEKTIELVAKEIEKTRRRVNALEYILIPQQEEVIKIIEHKLDELERSNITRLMKIKELLGM